MRLERLLRKNFWIVWLLLLCCGAFFTARAFSLGLALVLPAGAAGPAVPSPWSGAQGKTGLIRSPSAGSMLAHNPFDHTTGPLEEPSTAAGVPASTTDAADPLADQACVGVTVTAIVAATDPEESFAALAESGDAKVVLRRRGQVVAGKQVYYIRWDRVWMTEGASRCQAKLFGKGSALPEKRVDNAPKAAAGALPPEIVRGIQKTGPLEYSIDRGTRDRIVENAAEFMKMVRVSPEKDGDRSLGIRLQGIRPGTVLGLLGIENGDRLQTVNGFDISNPTRALEALARLSTAERLTVQVDRGGKTVNLDYNVR